MLEDVELELAVDVVQAQELQEVQEVQEDKAELVVPEAVKDQTRRRRLDRTRP